MIIAIDFDGTIVEHAYPEIGKPIPFAVDTLLLLQKEGHQLILWTVRRGRLLQEAIDYCAQRGLFFYAENENYRGEMKEMGEDISFRPDSFIDDRNLGGLPDWGIIYNTVKATTNGENALQMMTGEIVPIGSERKKKGWFSTVIRNRK